MIRPSICNISDQGSDIEIDDVTNEIIDLMETDDETDLQPSENESDVGFVDDGENILSLKMHFL